MINLGWTRCIYSKCGLHASSLSQESVSADTIPRSTQLIAWDDMAFALCGLGDGTLVTFSLDPLTGEMLHARVLFLSLSQSLALSFSYSSISFSYLSLSLFSFLFISVSLYLYKHSVPFPASRQSLITQAGAAWHAAFDDVAVPISVFS